MDFEGSILISEVAEGQAPYTYMVTAGFQQSQVFPNQYKDGSYVVGIKDANGCLSFKLVSLKRENDCSSTTLAVTTTSTPISTTVIATGGISPYSYLWSNGSTSATATSFPPGSYSVKVTDAQGCNISLNGIVFCDENTVRIGTQCWGKTNLDVSNYRNGDPIPEVTDEKEWEKLTTGAWCYFENDAANGAKYGKLYNKYAVNDPRGLAPAGYHIATSSDFFSLIIQFGGVNAGGKLKATTDWKSPNAGATNSSGFTALPGGNRYSIGQFGVRGGEWGSWWGGLALKYDTGSNIAASETVSGEGKSVVSG